MKTAFSDINILRVNILGVAHFLMFILDTQTNLCFYEIVFGVDLNHTPAKLSQFSACRVFYYEAIAKN